MISRGLECTRDPAAADRSTRSAARQLAVVAPLAGCSSRRPAGARSTSPSGPPVLLREQSRIEPVEKPKIEAGKSSARDFSLETRQSKPTVRIGWSVVWGRAHIGEDRLRFTRSSTRSVEPPRRRLRQRASERRAASDRGTSKTRPPGQDVEPHHLVEEPHQPCLARNMAPSPCVTSPNARRGSFRSTPKRGIQVREVLVVRRDRSTGTACSVSQRTSPASGASAAEDALAEEPRTPAARRDQQLSPQPVFMCGL